MKKFFVGAVLLLLLVLSVSGCKSKQNCPAYSYAETELPVRV
jgi:uncharacterized protein YcfL